MTWATGWQLAMRLARREIHRSMGRSALVLALIGLPVAIIAAGITWSASFRPGPGENVAWSMGSAAGYVANYQTEVVHADPKDPIIRSSSTSEAKARAIAIPGWGEGFAARTAAIAGLTRARAIPIGTESLIWQLPDGGHRIINSLTAKPDPALRGRFGVVSGRWPQNAAEVAVTSYAVDQGMPDKGPLEVEVRGKMHRLSIVGVMHAYLAGGGMSQIVTDEPLNTPANAMDLGWVLDRQQPLAEPEARQLERYGLSVWSRKVLSDPATAPTTHASDSPWPVLALGSTMLVLVITLLVSPAFAVAAGQMRRSTALLAANGATNSQRRRVLLAQGLALGGTAAGIGVVAGTLLAASAVMLERRVHPWAVLGSPRIAGWALAALVLIAVVASAGSALWPSLWLRRMDVASQTRGHQSAGRPVRWVRNFGLILVPLSAFGAFRALRTHDLADVALPTVGLLLGGLLLLPTLLTAGARLLRPLPVALRLAGTDLSRHRGRSVPITAALMAGMATLTMGAISGTSYQEQGQQDYRAQAPIGTGLIDLDSDQREATATATLRRWVPQALVAPIGSISLPEPATGDQTPVLAAQGPGCSAPDSLVSHDSPDSGDRGRPAPTSGTNNKCRGLTAGRDASVRGTQIRTLPAPALITQFGLTGADADRVRRGALITHQRDLVRDNTVTLVQGTVRVPPPGGAATSPRVERRVTVPAVVVPHSAVPKGLFFDGGALMTDTLAQQNRWPTSVDTLAVRSNAGPITREVEQALSDHLGGERAEPVYVEHGYKPIGQYLLWAFYATIGLLLVIVTLIGTALALGEQEADQATLAGVGATRQTRRAIAASQALLVALSGVALGVVVGSVPGIAITYPVTDFLRGDGATPPTRALADPITAIPWSALGLVILAVPSAAAAVAWLAVRRSPTVTQRL